MKSKQITYVEPAPASASEIGLTIKCGRCNTLRTYKISTNLGLVVSNVHAGVGFSVVCTVCGTTIGVDIGHIPPTGYSHEGIRVVAMAMADTVTVEDEIGLTLPDQGFDGQHRTAGL